MQMPVPSSASFSGFQGTAVKPNDVTVLAKKVGISDVLLVSGWEGLGW